MLAIASALVLLLGSLALQGGDAAVRQAALSRVPRARGIAADPEVLKAVLSKNAQGETAAQIQTRDRQWAANPRDPLRAQLTGNPCAVSVRALVRDDPSIVEVIVMDSQGANVCASRETSDYWQGDEAKWTRTVKEGLDPFVDAPALDGSTGVYAIQLSVPIVHEGARVGAVTMTVKVARAKPGS